MYFLFIKRAVRQKTMATGKFEPRTNTNVTTELAGPFTARKLAERSAAAALATYTCMGVEVLDQAMIDEIITKGYAFYGNDLTSLALKARRLTPKEVAQ